MLGFILVALLLFKEATSRDAGILYEVWHSPAAYAMQQVREKVVNQQEIRHCYRAYRLQLGGQLLTTELVIRSNGNSTLNDVYLKYGLNADIWNVQPRAGFYCIYRKRPDQAGDQPDCANITQTLTYHAKLLVDAGFDYIAVDVTNWPFINAGISDLQVVRPTEVLFEEWAALRKRGVKTPQIAIWPCSPKVATGPTATWQYMLNSLYNNPAYADLIYKIDGKKVVFIPKNPSCYDDGVAGQIRSNGGRNDVLTVNMWALFGQPDYQADTWGFFSPCLASGGGFTYTTSIVGEGDCNQAVSSGNLFEVSASSSYMLTQTALPFASPGHFRGLTLQRLFKKVLETGAPHLFISSFNEHIGGRQTPSSPSNNAFNMGLPNDPQRGSVWVDTYASEFSRDIEPTVEGGSRVWDVASSCVTLYKTGKTCATAPNTPCCTTADKEIFVNIWSLTAPGGADYLLTNSPYEREVLKKQGWSENCNAFSNPSAFCVDTNLRDARAGPFIIYSVQQPNTRALYRCFIPQNGKHFFSLASNCEGQKTEFILGYISLARGGETLRALRRCGAPVPGTHVHALDLECDIKDAGVLGYVR